MPHKKGTVIQKMDKQNNNYTKLIRTGIIIFILVLIVAIIGLLMLKYEVEGETNMPFELSRIMIVSTAEGIEKEESTNKWDLDIVQINDIYLEINKNENYSKTEIIKKITIDNLTVKKAPEVGKIEMYKTNQNSKYDYLEENKITDKLEYIGDTKNDIQNLKIANQGGRIILRYANKEIGEYTSNEDGEINHDGTLIGKTQVSIEQMKCKVSFDITIELVSEKKYKANIELELPAGDIITQGKSSIEKTDFTDIIFKRI